MTRALLLNTDWSPLHFITAERAVVLVFKGRAEIVSPGNEPSIWTEYFSSPGPVLNGPPKNYPVPATIRVLNTVHKRWKAPRFRKKVLFNRDGWKCQYCLSELNWSNITIEHIVPQSKGGPTTWTNCVSACRPCNSKKKNRTPEEAGMKLHKQPTIPTALHFWDAMKSTVWHDDWNMLLPERV